MILAPLLTLMDRRELDGPKEGWAIQETVKLNATTGDIASLVRVRHVKRHNCGSVLQNA
jgi:hypothetical protein